jgi:hypothetical protein
MATIRHLYPGANTARGFVGCFEQILPTHKARRIYVLKGGPGVGKSTFMRNIGEVLLSRGFDIEHFHCSSDSDSLDGVLAPKAGLLFVDGTAPHIVDPVLPGALDNIIHLGDCFDESALEANRTSIAMLSAEVSGCFARAYRYLGAAHRIREDSAAVIALHADEHALSLAADKLIDAHLPKRGTGNTGSSRRLFVSAITPKGLLSELNSQPAQRRIAIVGPYPSPTHGMLERIAGEALRRGYDAELFGCPLDPLRLDHILIPERGLLFYTVNPYHGEDVPEHEKVDLNAFVTLPTQHELAVLLKNEDLMRSLLGCAVEALARAKALHDEMETYYVRATDFRKVDALLEITKARIEPVLQTS